MGPAQVVEGGHSYLLHAPGPLSPTLSWELWTHPDSPEAWLVFQGPPPEGTFLLRVFRGPSPSQANRR